MRRNLRRFTAILWGFVAVGCMQTHVSAFSVVPHVILGRRTSLLARTRTRMSSSSITMVGARWAPVSDDFQKILDGSLEEGLKRSAWEGSAPAIEKFKMEVLHKSPPLFRIPNFLSSEECDAIIKAAIDNNEEATEYLNARVNSEVKGVNTNNAGTGYSEQAANEAVRWSGGATSGLRRRLPRETLRMLQDRVLAMLGEVAEGREIEMVEPIYIRPDALRVLVRDATVVHYKGGEGVAPHVDGKDATLLCYLNDVPRGAGGRTVFPEVNIASEPKRGYALLYDSRKDLLHFAEPVAHGHEKWVMQLLIDFKYVKQPGGMHVDFKTGTVTRLRSSKEV